MADNEKFKVEEVIRAIQGSRGIKTVIAHRLGCHRRTIDNYIKRYVTIAEAFDQERESIIDLAEVKLIQKIKIGHWPAIRLALTTLGKNRGYVERSELTGGDGGPVEYKITEVVVELPPDDKPMAD